MATCPPDRVKSVRNRSCNIINSIADAPEYLVQTNPYILGGYRREMSFMQAISTLFIWHNETINIWSHLIAFLVFIGFVIEDVVVFSNDRMPLFIFHFGCSCLFAVSTCFHLFSCVNKNTFTILRKLDFCAITFVIHTMFWSYCRYAFWDWKIFAIYISISFTSACVCVFVFV
jgi:adiponectin receptor